MSSSVEALSAAQTYRRWVGARRAWKAGRAGRRFVELRRLDRRHSVAGGPEGKAGSPGNPHSRTWRHNVLKRLDSRPETVWPGCLGAPDLVLGVPRPSSRTIPVASRRMAEAPNDTRGAHVSAPPLVAQGARKPGNGTAKA